MRVGGRAAAGWRWASRVQGSVFWGVENGVRRPKRWIEGNEERKKERGNEERGGMEGGGD